jgi:hypothetical protein
VGRNFDKVAIVDSELDFDTERRLILDTLKRSEISCEIRYDSATTDKLIEVFELNPKIIHISCHGIFVG